MHEGSSNPLDDVKWILGIIIVLAVGWFATGGLSSETSRSGPFLRPPPPFSEEPVSGPDLWSGGELLDIPLTDYSSFGSGADASGRPSPALNTSFSPLRGMLRIETVNAGGGVPANQEYVVLRAAQDNGTRVPVTGLRLESAASGRFVTIGTALALPMPGQAQGKEAAYLGPGESATIVTGRSPNGLSFRTNVCTGYFEQFQNFTPSLSLACPDPLREKLPAPPNALDDACLDFIDELPRCRIPTDIPLELSDTCELYVTREIHYGKCVEKHRDDGNFFGDEWRIYLSRDSNFWKERRETIKLVDHGGKLIDSFTY